MTEERRNAQKPSDQNASQAKYIAPLKDRLQGKKSNAKRIGVKSVLSYGDGSLAITKFGKGNSAEIVLHASNGGRDAVTPMKTDDFTIRRIDDEIELRGALNREELESMLHNPTESVAQDLLKLKGTLEKEFFGKEFPNSNVHIQLIHNVLDIQKILGLYISDIVYTINNLQASEFQLKSIKYDSETNNVTEEPDSLYDRICNVDDVLGSSLKSEARQKEILFKLRPYLGFFGDAFQIPKNENNNDALSPEDIHNVNVLSALAALRHWTSHWRDDIIEKSYPFFDKDKSGDQLLNGVKSDWGVVAANYKNKIDRVNKSFLDNSKKNVNVLYDILHLRSDAEKKNLVQDYYNFSIVKQGKNLGLNIVKLRECIIDKYYPKVKDKICDPHRSKIYTIADYLIYRHLKNNPEAVSRAVMRLQSSINEDQKTGVYKRMAIDLWTKLEGQLAPFFKASCVKSPEYVRGGKDAQDSIPIEWIDKVKLKSEDGIPFVMLLSLLCNFLEGKEINELLTAYIHKFENIQSFIDTLTELGESVQFTQPYSAFNSMNNQYASEAARQLRALASVGKMKPDLSEAKKALYIAAIQTLGATDEQYSDEFISKNILLDRSNSKEYELRKKNVNPFRNFIANNVIESRRFQYLVRYSKPKIVRRLMNNAAIVRYTLSRLPEKQINLYYNRTSEIHPNAKQEEKLDQLTRIVTGLRFQTVIDKKDNIVFKDETENVERLKAQISLYLTIAYVAIKQLVKINARYYIAYQILERDTELMKKKVNDSETSALSRYFIRNNNKDQIYFGLIRYFLNQDDERYKEIEKWKSADKQTWFTHVRRVKKEQHLNSEWRRIFHRDIEQSFAISKTGFLQVLVRNLTEHLIVLSLLQDYVELFRKNASEPMTSYFELYHFLMQSILHQVNELDLKFFSKDVENGIADDRLVKIAYVPFAYNLARYKNLTIDALFDEDGVNGQNFLSQKCYKEAFNRIATAKRRGKPSETIEALKKEFIEQYESEEEANNAARLGELWSYEDDARQKGLKGEPFPEQVLIMMKFKKFTEEEVAKVQHAYDAARRNSGN